jgi:hypothetical protein
MAASSLVVPRRTPGLERLRLLSRLLSGALGTAVREMRRWKYPVRAIRVEQDQRNIGLSALVFVVPRLNALSPERLRRGRSCGPHLGTPSGVDVGSSESLINPGRALGALAARSTRER